ncbi:DUF4389 domain-containing protein [Mycobacterium sp.]|uniref:DUF4389 domain-containing protein n=1 Tax=Mycobacterium sp. TaxID=1785 RepID=UPI003C725F08
MAKFDDSYPVRLRGDLDASVSRWLWLIKWLLLIPHYLVIAAIVSGMVHLSDDFDDSGSATIPPFGVLVVIIIAALLFTGRYPRGLFDFLLGINRWMFRVRAYALLFRDEYPPFRLDQGPREPGAHSPPAREDATIPEM